MDFADVTRIVTLIGYLLVVVLAAGALRKVKFSYRRFAVLLVGGVGTLWAAFYAWVIPTFWGTRPSTEELRDLTALLSRTIHLSTAFVLVLVLYVIRQAEALSNSQAADAAERIKEALD